MAHFFQSVVCSPFMLGMRMVFLAMWLGLACAKVWAQGSNPFQKDDYASTAQREAENRLRIEYNGSRISTLESMKLEGRLARIENEMEATQYWFRFLAGGIMLLLIEAFVRNITTRLKGGPQ